MEDDLALGASVWGGPSDFAPVLSINRIPSTSTDDGFDDFDNFRTPAETVIASGDEGDDDFGDFGDFGDAQTIGGVPSFVEEAAFDEDVRIPGPSAGGWEPLQLEPLPSRQELQEQIDEILGPLWATMDLSQLSDERIREVEGLSQTLVTPESRKLYTALLPPTPPTFEPVNWTRSRIRRRHLITLGIPVNLDEVLPRANSRLPMLEITTRPMSAPPGPRTVPATKPAPSMQHSRSGTPRPGTPSTSVGAAGPSVAAQLRLGPRPNLDERRASELLDLDPDRLTMSPLNELEGILAALKTHTIDASAMLTYLLQTRDALQQDSETYNKLIGELVGEAQKIKNGKRTGNTPVRRGSAIS